jgi:predicted Fe-Mo cluster-binding NifX family protein
MKTAISVYDNRVAPVFDTAREVCLVEKTEGGGLTKIFCRFEDDDIADKITWLSKSGVKRLVCGAISMPLQQAMASAGIVLVPFVCGDLEEVIDTLSKGNIEVQAFNMPGCCGRRRGGGGGGGGGRGMGRGRRHQGGRFV